MQIPQSKTISKEYYPMMIQATDKQSVDRSHMIRRKSQKSFVNGNSIPTIIEENILPNKKGERH